jgi:hypothetical protein
MRGYLTQSLLVRNFTMKAVSTTKQRQASLRTLRVFTVPAGRVQING